MSDIVFDGWSDTWRTDLGYASVRSPDIRPPPQTILSIESNFGHRSVVRRNFLHAKISPAHTPAWEFFYGPGKSASIVRFKRQYPLRNGVYSSLFRTKASGGHSKARETRDAQFMQKFVGFTLEALASPAPHRISSAS